MHRRFTDAIDRLADLYHPVHTGVRHWRISFGKYWTFIGCGIIRLDSVEHSRADIEITLFAFTHVHVAQDIFDLILDHRFQSVDEHVCFLVFHKRTPSDCHILSVVGRGCLFGLYDISLSYAVTTMSISFYEQTKSAHNRRILFYNHIIIRINACYYADNIHIGNCLATGMKPFQQENILNKD